MPRPLETRAVLRTFLASPEDVAPERELASQIVQELNLIWSRFLGLMLELVRWETHAYPGVGVDLQALINNQIGDEYELFIGVMWSRFGTPTNRAGSGTEEEFERAYARHQADPDSVRIMFYFKSAPPPPAADAAQCSQVIQFRQRLGGEGVLYWMYENDQNFTTHLRLHLSRQMQDIHNALSNSVLGSGTLHPSWPRRTLSLLKLVPPHFVDGFRVLQQLRGLGIQWRRFGALFTSFGTSVKRIDVKAPAAPAQMNSVAQLTASSLLQLVADTRPLLSAFDRSFRSYMDSVAKMAPLFVGWPGHSLVRQLILSQLKRLHSGINSGVPGYVEMRATLSDLGSMHGAFEEASPVAAAFFADVLATWTRALTLVDEAERTYAAFE
jgi:hypothetical protein